MRYDHFSMLPEKAFQPRNGRRGMTLEGGGGGGGPTTNTTYTSNVPNWLRPQTEALLGAATQEYFKTQYIPGRPAQYDAEGNLVRAATKGKHEIVGVKPYRAYSENKEDYLAQFNPQQQQVFGEVAQMQTSPYYQLGAGMTGITGGTAFDYGQQAAGLGGVYERMATDPMSMQAYMSPYMQQVVERQKQYAVEDAQKANLSANLAASRRGAYGGSRQALAQAQREAALNRQLGDIQATGLQSAFDKAQAAQQFGIRTGLEGLQTGLQGIGLTGQMGAQLANIASAEQEADMRRLGLQRDVGKEQQAREQAIIDQSIQDYAMAEQYPYQQLAAYNALLRGYATPTTTVSQYKAAPSSGSQLLGTATQLGGVAQILGAKAGGQVKSFAQGGIAQTEALADKLSIPQLQQSIENNTLPEYIGIPMLEEKVDLAERMQLAQGIAPNMGGEPPIADQVMQRANQLQGINAAPVTVAGGGIIAFDNGGVTSQFGRDVQGYRNALEQAREDNKLRNLLIQKYGRAGGPFGYFVGQTEEERKKAQDIMSRINKLTSSEMQELLGMPITKPNLTSGDVARMEVDKALRSTPVPKPEGGITEVAEQPGGGDDYIDTEKDNDPNYGSKNLRGSGASSYTGPAKPPVGPGIAPQIDSGAPAKEPTMAELLAQASRERKEFLGEDPRIAKMKAALEKQGQESFLDRALRGLQTMEAGRRLREEGDSSGLAKVIETEAARKEAAAKRDERRAELEGAEYLQKVDLYKDVKALQREKSKSKEEQEFKKELVRLAQSVKPEEFSERIFKIATDPSAPKAQRDLANQILLRSTKTNELSRDEAFKAYNDPLNAHIRKQYKSAEDFYQASRVGSAGWGELRVK